MLSIPALTLLLGIPILGGGDDEPIPAFPVEATGDIHFQFDGARFLQDSTVVRELYLSIPQEELQAFATEEGDSAYQVEMRLDFLDGGGNQIYARKGLQSLPLLESAEGRGLAPAHTLTLRPEVPEQTRVVKASITDPNAQKRGLLYLIRGTKKSGEAEARFGRGPDPAPGGMSDILFVWSVAAPESREDVEVDVADSGLPLRSRILPNPSHFYGLFHTDLSFYLEIYPHPAREHEAGQLILEVERVRDSTVVRTGTDDLEILGRVVPVYRRFDINNLEGGTYLLRAIWMEGGETISQRTSPFQVLWEGSTWYLTEKELLEDASIVLSDEKYREFLALDRGNKELYMERFWKEHDPSPETPVNEVREEFERRKEFATANYGYYRKGKLSDRGRAYIRFGQPDEIDKELNPQDTDVIANAIQKEFSEEEQESGAQRNFLSIDNRAYEVWYYHLYGEPLIPEFLGPQVPREIKFIFIDQMGYGEYTLVYTNVFGGFR